MGNRNIRVLTRELIEAAVQLMERREECELTLFESLPKGHRISIEIAILPPPDPDSVGAMRAIPARTARRAH